ncbi:hypothetical protein RDABS01_016241 [Bienertia sinuspersici]
MECAFPLVPLLGAHMENIQNQHKSQHMKAEATYLELLGARCIPTEDTYALMLRAYGASGMYAKAEAIFSE